MEKTSLKAIIHDSLEVVKKRFSIFLTFMLTSFFLPAVIAMTAWVVLTIGPISDAMPSFLNGMQEGDFPDLSGNYLIASIVGYCILMLVMMASQMIFNAGSALIVRSYYDGETVSLKSVWRYGLHRLGAMFTSALPLVLLYIVLFGAAFGGLWATGLLPVQYTYDFNFTILLALLGMGVMDLVIVAISFFTTFVPYAAAHRGTHFLQSFRLNFKILFYNKFWLKNIGYLLVLCAISAAFSMVVQMVLGVVMIPAVVLMFVSMLLTMELIMLLSLLLASVMLLPAAAFQNVEYILMEHETWQAGKLDEFIPTASPAAPAQETTDASAEMSVEKETAQAAPEATES